MVDKLAHLASAAHMSAVKAMGFADWFPESVRKPQIVQEVQSLDMFMWNGVCVCQSLMDRFVIWSACIDLLQIYLYLSIDFVYHRLDMVQCENFYLFFGTLVSTLLFTICLQLPRAHAEE